MSLSRNFVELVLAMHGFAAVRRCDNGAAVEDKLRSTALENKQLVCGFYYFHRALFSAVVLLRKLKDGKKIADDYEGMCRKK
jgi:hypothetical protein